MILIKGVSRVECFLKACRESLEGFYRACIEFFVQEGFRGLAEGFSEEVISKRTLLSTKKVLRPWPGLCIS